ncbi:translation initiation factor IF-2-like [Cervus canadensis]|uniref:translation initiation factor IF-2-like n=1 Tax=Cervus canadensis TaxID=1574408 RepID=UPI001C9E2612|nr:translation initiation factor IF-2-like [Cervus canadensis]
MIPKGQKVRFRAPSHSRGSCPRLEGCPLPFPQATRASSTEHAHHSASSVEDESERPPPLHLTSNPNPAPSCEQPARTLVRRGRPPIPLHGRSEARNPGVPGAPTPPSPGHSPRASPARGPAAGRRGAGGRGAVGRTCRAGRVRSGRGCSGAYPAAGPGVGAPAPGRAGTRGGRGPGRGGGPDSRQRASGCAVSGGSRPARRGFLPGELCPCVPEQGMTSCESDLITDTV